MLNWRPFAAVAAVCAIVFGVSQIGGGSTPQSATGSVHPAGWGGTPSGVKIPTVASGVPTAEMWDTITLSTVPANPFALAGYTSGSWPTYLLLRKAYPNAHTISIAVNSRNHADCLDDEPGDATPAQAGPWAVADIAAGFAKPCVYSDLSNMPSVQASLAAALGPTWRSRVFLWLAWYRYTPGLVAGYDAVQWTDRAHNLNLDESTVTLDFLTIAQPPYVPPKPPPPPPPPPNPKVCAALRQRANWFARQLRLHPHVRTAHRKAALAATLRALHRNRCK